MNDAERAYIEQLAGRRLTDTEVADLDRIAAEEWRDEADEDRLAHELAHGSGGSQS